MYNVSNDFHTAVATGKPQICLLCFPDAVFSNEDIDISGEGVEFVDHFCTDQDICIGKALSNEWNFTLFNDLHLLDEYEFGEIHAYLGAKISRETVTNDGTANILLNVKWVGNSSEPYLTRNGTAVSSQPPSAVNSLVYYNDRIYAFYTGGCKVYKKDGTADSTIIVSSSMIDKMNRLLRGKGITIDYSRSEGIRYVIVRQGTEKRTYEIVPMGYFNADRPNVGTTITLNFNTFDRMQLFEKDMPSDAELGITYPVTFETLLNKICQYVGVTNGATGFINSTAQLTERPDAFDSVTMRTVVAWIAEAAASIAKFDRDGVLQFMWYSNTTQTYDEHKYRDYHPYWYATPVVDKLYNRTTAKAAESIVGTGDIGYLIQDNPLLEGVE